MSIRPETRAAGPIAPTPAASAGARWLLFVHQLPARSSNPRVRTWRRLQQIGAIAVKQAVYVLPDSPAAREDFEWLKTEIESAGGEAAVFAASSIDTWSDDALIDAFRRSRQEAYTALAAEIDAILRKVDARRRRRAGRAPAVGRLLAVLRERFAAVERVDFFGAAGRDRVAALLTTLEERLVASRRGRGGVAPEARGDVKGSEYRGRLWVTRPRPGVDRMSSAWLIRRFIDPKARFGFADDRHAVPAGAVPFDMFGVDLTHRADRCTFETLCDVFGIAEAAVGRLAAIVHDLDLKDGRFAAPETPAVGMMIDGLQLSYADDEALLEQGMVLFEALYQAASRMTRIEGPRMVARRQLGGRPK